MTSKKAKEQKKDAKVRNGIFENFINPAYEFNGAFEKLGRLVSNKISYRLGVHLRKVLDSPEFKEYVERRNEILKEHRDNKIKEFKKLSKVKKLSPEDLEAKVKEFEKTISYTTDDIPSWKDLMEVEHDKFQIEKFKLKGDDIKEFEIPDLDNTKLSVDQLKEMRSWNMSTSDFTAISFMVEITGWDK